MQDEMGGQSPEEMGLQPEDLKTDSDQKEDKSSGFFNKARTEAWKAMGETDQLAIVTQKLESRRVKMLLLFLRIRIRQLI